MSRQSGFTLLELLIALTLMGLVLALLYGGLRLGIRSWDAGEARAEAGNDMRLVQEFIRRRLRESVTVYRSDESYGRVPVFAGEPESIRFVTPMLTHLGLGGLYEVRLGVVEDDGIGRLVMRWSPYRAEDLDEVGGAERVLVEDVSTAQWAYFGAVAVDEEPQWYERWPNPRERPRLVSLRLTVRGEPWPTLVAGLPD